MIFLKKKQVLIVDDEVDLREMLALELKNYQTTVFEAKNGLEAFELIKKENIDLVISDIRMPGGNGIEFLKKTKAINIKSPQFVFITRNERKAPTSKVGDISELKRPQHQTVQG